MSYCRKFGDGPFFLFIRHVLRHGGSDGLQHVTTTSGAASQGLVYPISARLVWGGGWLQQMGFVDFAGAIWPSVQTLEILGNTWDFLSDGCLMLLTVATPVSLTSLAGSATVHLVGAVSALARFPGFTVL